MRHRTTIGAAEDLGMSQPAVSNAIKLTEVKMGFPLFDRVSNRLVPTEEARILCAEAEPLFLMYQAIQQKAWDLRTGRTGVLRLCATAELSEFLVPKALRQFIGSHPNVKIHVETLRMDAVLDCVEMGISDVGVAINPPSRPGLIQEILIETEMMCISPIDYGLQQQADLTPSDLRGRRLIGPPADSPFRTLLENAFQQSGAHFRPDLEVRFAMNMNVLDGGLVPKVMNIKEVLRAWLNHRQVVLVRRSQFRLEAVLHRLEVLAGYIIYDRSQKPSLEIRVDEGGIKVNGNG